MAYRSDLHWRSRGGSLPAVPPASAWNFKQHVSCHYCGKETTLGAGEMLPHIKDCQKRPSKCAECCSYMPERGEAYMHKSECVAEEARRRSEIQPRAVSRTSRCGKCFAVVLEQDVESHQWVCTSSTCIKCGQLMTPELRTAHSLHSCPFRDEKPRSIAVRCDWCKLNFKPDEYDKHVESECPFRPVKCPHGCGAVMCARLVDFHLNVLCRTPIAPRPSSANFDDTTEPKRDWLKWMQAVRADGVQRFSQSFGGAHVGREPLSQPVGSTAAFRNLAVDRKMQILRERGEAVQAGVDDYRGSFDDRLMGGGETDRIFADYNAWENSQGY